MIIAYICIKKRQYSNELYLTFIKTIELQARGRNGNYQSTGLWKSHSTLPLLATQDLPTFL
ncbi:hypothetical protein DXB82_19675, partial [Phocaeicola vulgatus]